MLIEMSSWRYSWDMPASAYPARPTRKQKESLPSVLPHHDLSLAQRPTTVKQKPSQGTPMPQLASPTPMQLKHKPPPCPRDGGRAWGAPTLGSLCLPSPSYCSPNVTRSHMSHFGGPWDPGGRCLPQAQCRQGKLRSTLYDPDGGCMGLGSAPHPRQAWGRHPRAHTGGRGRRGEIRRN